MKVSDFDYGLPEGLIAQEPLPRRDASRLMILERDSGAIAHRRFTDLPHLLETGDLLVLNDTRVVPARLIGAKPTGGAVKVLALERVERSGSAEIVRCLVESSRTARPGTRIRFGNGLSAVVIERDGASWLLRFEDDSGAPWERIEQLGIMPLPPYIRREPGDRRAASDRERYQTIYACRPGAVAAPTAGLHFTREMLRAIEDRGVSLAYLTLHVGLGTFQPVRSERVEDHVMHSEAFEIPGHTASAVASTKRAGRRVVAVGTTVVRALESTALLGGAVSAGGGRCDLFIRPGFEFRVVDAMVTNFHLPRSTLLMLVSAFAGRERVLAAYAEAVRRGYRFYSYGDAMFVRSSR